MLYLQVFALIFTHVLMSILCYLKCKDGVPDPKGLISASISSSAIVSANWEVREAIVSLTKGRWAYIHCRFLLVSRGHTLFLAQVLSILLLLQCVKGRLQWTDA